MRYDRGDSFPFDLEPNGVPFGSKLKETPSPRSYPIQFECTYPVVEAPVGELQVAIQNNSITTTYRDP